MNSKLNLEHYPYSKDQVKHILSLCLASGLSFNEIQNRLVPTSIVMSKVLDKRAKKLFNDLNDILMNGTVDLKSWNDMVIIITRLRPYFDDYEVEK